MVPSELRRTFLLILTILVMSKLFAISIFVLSYSYSLRLNESPETQQLFFTNGSLFSSNLLLQLCHPTSSINKGSASRFSLDQANFLLLFVIRKQSTILKLSLKQKILVFCEKKCNDDEKIKKFKRSRSLNQLLLFLFFFIFITKFLIQTQPIKFFQLTLHSETYK